MKKIKHFNSSTNTINVTINNEKHKINYTAEIPGDPVQILASIKKAIADPNNTAHISTSWICGESSEE